MDQEFRARLEQRRRALEEGFDLLGWSFDPLDAAAAKLFVGQLGAIVERYLPDDDLLLAEWWIRAPHVERRLSSIGKLTLRERDAAEAPVIKRGQEPVIGDQRARTPDGAAAPVPRRVWVEIPLNADDTWREHVRDIFQTYLARRYRVVDFVVDNPNGIGRYLFALKE